ncbi:MAG: Hint domain-containing protein [Paracoccaceae bacterium]
MAIINGDNGDNNLNGTAGDDTINGLGGNDTLTGNGGADAIIGGTGDDLLDGGADNDTLSGGFGNDTLIGATGQDLLAGGNQNDSLDGGEGSDTLIGGSGDDTLMGGAGGDSLVGDAGQDLLDYSGSDAAVRVQLNTGSTGTASGGHAEGDTIGIGNDDITGSAFNDTLIGYDDPFFTNNLSGGDGDDFIDGRGGEDNIMGDAGNDTIIGGAGNDTMQGGSGDDVFDLNPGFGNDSVTDFVLGEDLFDVRDIPSLFATDPQHPIFPREVTVTSAGPSTEFPGGSQIITFPDGSTVAVPAGTIRVDTTENRIMDLIEAGITCFTRGTLISTPRGEVPIEALQPGDRVITRDGSLPIRWIGSRRVAAIGDFAPIMIQAGAMGNHSDLMVSPQHRMYVADPHAELLFGESEVLVPAKHLENGDTIYRAVGGEVEYWHIMFDTHQIVYANGSMSESFHPGQQALSSLDEDARNEILMLFPDLVEHPATAYGATAARVLRKPEANYLLASMAFPIDSAPTQYAARMQ